MSDILSTENEKTEITIIEYIPQEKVDGRVTLFFRPIVKGFGLLSTVTLGVLALSPDTFHLSEQLRSWTFVLFIVWACAFCMGFFTL